jgi:hypothetical protein
MRIRKHHLVVLAAAGALVVGAGAAFAAGGSPPGAGNGPAAGSGQRGAGNGVMAGGVVMDAAADYVGITEAALAAERHDGTSLAQIAVAHGKTVAGLKAALVSAFRANLDAAVAAGRITSAQAAQALATFQSQLQSIVDRTAVGPANGKGPGAGAGAGPGLGLGLGNGPCRVGG